MTWDHSTVGDIYCLILPWRSHSCLQAQPALQEHGFHSRDSCKSQVWRDVILFLLGAGSFL